ncbi:HD domain-containing protein [Roseibium sp. SCPC15]|uniref:HD domain-containing protein n=1 Tax=Roseibium sp. SCP15 TaxID=3141376 RepID=UPI0033362C14
MTQTDTASVAMEADNMRLSGLLDFLQAAEQLKDTLRSGSTRKGRKESTAEHSWRLAFMILVFEKELGEVDIPKLLKLCLIHDLGEAISGDIPAPEQTPGDDRQDRERRDFQELCAPLPADTAQDLLSLWDEYAGAQTLEARLAKAFDKLETMLQHQLMPPRSVIFHDFNLSYGRSHTDGFPLTRQIRAFVDARTREIIAGLENEQSNQAC